MGLNVACLLACSLADPLVWERVSTGRNSSGQLTSVGHCISTGKVSIVMLGLILAVNLAAIFLACWKAFQTRHLTIAFNESAYIGCGVGSMLQAAAVGLPVLFLVQDNPISIYLVRSLLVFVMCAALVGFIFVPRILLSIKVDDNQMKTVIRQSSRVGAESNLPSSLVMRTDSFSEQDEKFSKSSSNNIARKHTARQ